ncbi:hypothetical protein [Photorhabdus cinerea]|uniref:Uncharacterized protein n=1 Tax=Photorhabdus cinerea TaxID=471575 RepID=A0A7X5QG72_9GAMM|nr:hypothetical protein [Photorhabdus cinerea]NHB93702.1 hypothetical protein [Photorhabdus cinerea]
MLFNPHLVSAVKPGIKPGDREIECILKSNIINFNKCVDTYAALGKGLRQFLLTLPMIRKLNKPFGISAESLINA